MTCGATSSGLINIHDIGVPEDGAANFLKNNGT